MREVILVTGCNDYVGSAITRHFSQSYSVISIDLYLKQNNLELHDYRSVHFSRRTRFEQVLRNLSSEYGYYLKSVIHLRSPTDHYDVVKHLMNVFKIEQFIFLDFGHKFSIDESDVPTVNLHVSDLYDDGCHLGSLSEQISGVFEERLRSHFYYSEKTSSYLHVDDLIKLLAELVEHQNALPQKMDLSLVGHDRVTEKELVGELGRLIHHEEWPMIKIPHYTHSDKITSNLDSFTPIHWHPDKSLLMSLPRMIELLKADPVKWYEENREENIYHAL